MHRGLYESLLTLELDGQLAQNADLEAEIGSIDAIDQPHVLARHLQVVAERVIAATKDPVARVALVNALIEHLNEAAATVSDPPRQLLRLRGRSE